MAWDSRAPVRLLAGALLSSLAFSQASHTGIHPRSSASDYAASTSASGVTYGASQLSPDQVKHLFAADISKSYLVLEVACFPSDPTKAEVVPSDFLIRTGAKGEYAHSVDAATVASVIEQKERPHETRAPVSTEGGVGVGVASGTDPVTGRHVHTVYTEADAGVSSNPPAATYPRDPAPPRVDGATLEAQLATRALPEGNFPRPVAGYLYFPASYVKKHSGTSYALEYTTSAGVKVELSVPASK